MKNIFLLFILASFFGSCATQSRSRAYVKHPADRFYQVAAMETNAYAGPSSNDVEPPKTIKRIVIFNASVSLRVKNIDSTNAKLTQIAEAFGGYVVETNSYRSEIRVKASELENAIAAISKIGKVEDKSLSGSDVTDDYFDYSIRLDNAEKARNRYLQLLEKAEDVPAALAVEKELERLNGEIDLLKGKLNRLNHLVEYSTITIRIEEKQKLGILGYVVVGVARGIGWLFVR